MSNKLEIRISQLSDSLGYQTDDVHFYFFGEVPIYVLYKSSDASVVHFKLKHHVIILIIICSLIKHLQMHCAAQ